MDHPQTTSSRPVPPLFSTERESCHLQSPQNQPTIRRSHAQHTTSTTITIYGLKFSHHHNHRTKIHRVPYSISPESPSCFFALHNSRNPRAIHRILIVRRPPNPHPARALPLLKIQPTYTHPKMGSCKGLGPINHRLNEHNLQRTTEFPESPPPSELSSSKKGRSYCTYALRCWCCHLGCKSVVSNVRDWASSWFWVFIKWFEM